MRPHKMVSEYLILMFFAQPVFEVVPVLPISCRARPHIAQTERNKQIVVYYIYYFVHDILSYNDDSFD